MSLFFRFHKEVDNTAVYDFQELPRDDSTSIIKFRKMQSNSTLYCYNMATLVEQ